MDLQKLPAAMAEIGPTRDDVSSIVKTGDASWIIRFGDADIEFEADETSLAIVGIVGFAEATEKLRVYTTLLQYNLLQQDTGGVVLALNADSEVIQMLTLHEPPVSVEFLSHVLDNFLAKIRVWRQFMLAGDPGAEPIVFDPALLIRI